MCQITESARIYTTLSKYKNRNVRFINQRTKVVSTDPAELKIGSLRIWVDEVRKTLPSEIRI